MDADSFRTKILSKLVSETKDKKTPNNSLVEQCLNNRKNVEEEDAKINLEERKKILETVNMKLIEKMLR